MNMNSQPTRRDVLRFAAAAAGAAAAVAAVPSLALAVPNVAPPKRKIPVALELYSVRNEIAKDFDGVIRAVGKMGYEGVEFASGMERNKNPAEVRKLLDDSGLKCCGTHTALQTLEGDNLKKTIDMHKTLGNKYLICPSLSAKDAKGWLDLARKFNDLAAQAKEQGMLVGYHSHAGDFSRKFDGKTPWEIFFDNTNPEVIHQIDIGNTLDGGGDPLAMIKKYPGRTKTTHIKEHGGARGAPIGEGKIDWSAYFDAYETVGGTEWYIVEHEIGANPMESVKACIDNLRKMGR